MKRPAPSLLLRLLLTGTVAALPLAATAVLLVGSVQLLRDWVGPDSLVGQGLVRLGLGVSGSERLGYGLGLLLVLGGLMLLGLLIEAGLQRGLRLALQRLIERIPLVGSVHALFRRFVGLLAQRDAGGLATMQAVWCHFGGAERPGAVALGLLSSAEPVEIQGRAHLAVLLPTAPVPIGGGLLYLPADWVRPAGIGLEALTSLYVSMGVTSAEHLPRARPPAGYTPAGS